MALKQAVNQRILNEVIRPLKVAEQFKVLIVDKLSTRILSSCSKMTEIMSEGITLVEDLNKNREPLPALEAIYLITPSQQSIQRIISDFTNSRRPLYRCAHVFVTEALPDALFNEISKSGTVRFIKTLKEINISFVPYESRVFHLDMPDMFYMFYNQNMQISEARQMMLERSAEQLATLCATLSEYPNIRIRSAHEKNAEFANSLQRKLEAYKADDPTIGEGPQKDRSVLLILDRGFDPISPLLHECTYQAMAYDLLPIDNDTYMFAATNSQGQEQDKEVILDENDELYASIRHLHIAVLAQRITKELKDFTESHRMNAGDTKSAKDLSQIMKKLPQYQKELSRYTTHMKMAEDCMASFSNGLDRLCKVEQDLAMGFDESGERVRDAMKIVVPVLMEPAYTTNDKLRVILLYIMHKGGIPEENLNRLFQNCEIEAEERQTVFNLQQLNIAVLQDAARRMPKQLFNQGRKERNEQTYSTSRWNPFIKDIMEDVIEDKLDNKVYPFYGMQRQATGGRRFAGGGGWARDAKTQRSGPRLIVFIIGGVTYSELRAAYEVGASAKNWEVIIGSSHIITPKSFLDQLRGLSQAPPAMQSMQPMMG